jgi:hypothetical protein
MCAGTRPRLRRDCSYVINGAKMWITNGAVTDTEQVPPESAGMCRALRVRRRWPPCLVTL